MEMVSEAKVNGSEAESPTDLFPALAEKPAGLPPGKYALVGWDMDTTGRRLIDEIGVSSFRGWGGCEYGYPSGFARVTSFYNFIMQHMSM